ncbi:hypothetical protein [Methylomonas koyamae]|nr:hypothetical protein [Methylomonas koyamae]
MSSRLEDKSLFVQEFKTLINELDDPARIAEFSDPANFAKFKIAILVCDLEDSFLFAAIKKIISITKANYSNNISLLTEFVRVSELNDSAKTAELNEALTNADPNDTFIISVINSGIRSYESKDLYRQAKESGEIQTIDLSSIEIEKEFLDGGVLDMCNFIRHRIKRSEGRYVSFHKDELNFIADVLEGKIKKSKGRPANIKRDRKIAWMIDLYLRKEMKLTSSSKEEGAAALVATQFGIDEDAAIKAYQRMKPEIDAQYEEWKWNGYD